MIRRQRLVIALYGVASAFVFIWVPWRGGPTVRGATTEAMGYGFVWSGPTRPIAFVDYEKRLAEYKVRHPGPYTVEYPPETPPLPPTEPEGYSGYPYKLATRTLDYGRILLEFAALTGLFLAVLMLTRGKAYGNN
jgi:hypothetical protein